MRKRIAVGAFLLASGAWAASNVVKPGFSGYTAPLNCGSNGQVLTTNGTCSTSWTTPTTISLPVGSVPYADSGGNLTGVTSDMFFRTSNHFLGMGTVTPDYPIEIRRSLNGAPSGVYAQNQHSGGDTVFAAANDIQTVMQIGCGGTGFSAPYAANSFWTSTADIFVQPAAGKNFYTYPAGRGFGISEGANAKMGTFTLASGLAWVANTSLTANSRVFLTIQTKSGTSSGVGVSSITVSAGFNAFGAATDNSTVAYEIIEAY